MAERCLPAPFDLSLEYNGELVLRIDNVGGGDFDFDVGLHECEYELCDGGLNCEWLDDSGTESTVNLALDFGGSGFTLDLTELTKGEDGDSGLELKASADGLERLEVDAKVFDGTDYLGNEISKDIDIPIGWRLESGGSLFFQYDGTWKGIKSYSIIANVNGDDPVGVDTLMFDPKGTLWICSGDEYKLDRSGDWVEVCGDRIRFQTITP